MRGSHEEGHLEGSASGCGGQTGQFKDLKYFWLDHIGPLYFFGI